jgi:outer membrane receptor for ferrienterochelin and colicin
MSRILSILVFSILSSVAVAQTGSITGAIKDAATGEAIIGANVVIQGTTVGAATDVEGNFTIPKVKPGTYTLVVSYVTYKNHLVPDLVVEASKISEVVVLMTEDSKELEAVVVTGMRDINTDVSMISAIRENKLVVSGISAEQISLSQDRDAAQVVRRIPGITLQDNRFVVVRGLSSRYSAVILNGVLAPSTEADSRAFSFDIIPSGLIDRMLVYKSGGAYLPGDFAGSIIQVDTKTVTSEDFTNVSLIGGARINTTFTQQQSQQRASTEWLGFDNGMRALPSGTPSDIRSLKNVSDIESLSKKFKNTWGLQDVTVTPDVRFSLDFGRNFNLGNLEVSTINAISYSNTNQANEVAFNRYINYNPDFTSEYRFKYNDQTLINNVRIGLLSNWSFRLSDKTRIEFRNLYNRLGTTATAVREGVNYFQGQEYQNYSMRYIGRGVYSGQLEGKHTLVENKSKLSWLVGFTSASRQEPDWKRLTTARNINSAEGTPFTVVVPSSASPSQSARFYQDLTEIGFTNRLDFDYKIKENEAGAFELKTGYWLEYKTRSFQARQIGHIAREGFSQEIARLPYDQIFDIANVAYNGGHIIGENSKETDAYDGTNLYGAGYVNFNLPVSKKWLVIPGIRVEHNIQRLENLNQEELVDNPITSVLPFLNVAYNFSSSALVRLAYSKTVNRPEFRELAPFSFYDFDNQADIVGNPNLKIANIQNIDLRWEYYPTPSEFISVGGFYKFFDNPIETNILNGADNAIFVYNNADKAQNFGVEVEIRKALAYSSPSRFLNNTSVIFNASYIISKIELVNDGTLLEKDSRPMQGQSPYIVNGGLSYNDSENGFQASLQYNVFGKRIAFVGDPATPTWWEMPRQILDLTVSKRLSRHADLKFGISDILNSKVFIREDANLDNDVTDDKTNRIIRSTQNGQYITLGVAVKL